jgi:outer membrane protein OmpA-like peptidoglycan-associated protein
MGKHRNVLLGTLAIGILLHFNVARAGSDMPGSHDHPKIPRVADTSIIGFAESNYDEGVFMTGAAGRELVSENVEGKRTRIMYVGPTSLSPLAVLRNYQKALADLGEVEEVYSCKGDECFQNLGDAFVWRESNRIPTIFDYSQQMYAGRGYKDQVYWYGTVANPESLYHVSVYSAVSAPPEYINQPWAIRVRNHPLIHLEVVEVADFTPTLEVVNAEDMTAKIGQKGHIALYGIYFDSDSDQLKPESDPTLNEIAKALQADAALRVYVVGHTDNKGTLEYNEDLSKRRALAVVNELSSKHDIARDRMIPIGAGLIAPVATNKTEDGRALNRRVELVER